MARVHNTNERIAQLSRRGPSTDTYNLCKECCVWLGTTSSEIATATGLQPSVVIWAFTLGKTDRAAEVRKLVIDELNRRLTEGAAV